MDHHQSNMKDFFQKKRIMVVYNNYEMMRRFLIELNQAKIPTDEFVDPLLALRIFKTRNYDLVLIETHLARISGFEFSSLVTKIRKVLVCFVTPMYWYYDSLRDIYPNLSTDCFISPLISQRDFTILITKKLQYTDNNQ